jgi:hypothetical protein
MAKYKVITISVAVKNNRIAKFGEEVDDSELTVNGNALVVAGSLQLIKGTETQEVIATEKTETETEEVEEKEEKVDSKKAKTAAEKVAEKNK